MKFDSIIEQFFSSLSNLIYCYRRMIVTIGDRDEGLISFFSSLFEVLNSFIETMSDIGTLKPGSKKVTKGQLTLSDEMIHFQGRDGAD